MKRTLKRESKVLEIVRREAIGAGGSFLVRGCSMVICLSGGLQRWRVLTCLRSVFVLAHHHAFSPGDEPASASCLMRWLTGVWGSKGLAGRLHSRVLPVRPSVPAIAGAEEPINPCPQGRGSVSPWRVCVWGSGTDARVHACRSVARVHLWWVSDAGGTALIDPS